MTDNQKNTLPKNWELKTLGEVCEIFYGKGLSTQNLKSEGFPVFGANGIIGFYDKFLFEESKVLISCRGAYSGKINFSPEKCHITNNSLIVDVLDNNKLDKYFLYYSLQIANKAQLVTGSAQPQVTINNATDLQIPLPPLPEQQKIVQKIESLFTELETGTKALKRALNQLKIYRQAVLNHFLKDESWEVVRLKEVNLFITDGDHQAPPKADVGIPFVVISNIKNNKLDLSKTRFVSEEYYENLSEYRKAKKGDILYTVTGSYGIPVLLISDEKFCFQRHIGLLKPDTDRVSKEYLLYCLLSQNVFNQATKVATGTAQLTVPLSGLRNIKIPLPPLEIQTQIVAEIEKRMVAADALEASLKSQLINAENLRQSILKRAFEGKLV